MPFSFGKRPASICVVLGQKKSSTYSSEYGSGFFEPVASHLPAAPLPRNEGLLGQAPSAVDYIRDHQTRQDRCTSVAPCIVDDGREQVRKELECQVACNGQFAMTIASD
jgi:hypothetical protein